MTPELITLDAARWRLAVVWFSASAVLFVLLMLQSLIGAYENRLQAAWGWALPNFVPTLALMISVFAADALKPYDPAAQPLTVRKTFFKLSMGLSIFYLVILLASILAQPIVKTYRTGTPLSSTEILELSNLWLGPMQGLVVAALGVLFFLKEQDGAATRDPRSVQPPLASSVAAETPSSTNGVRS